MVYIRADYTSEFLENLHLSWYKIKSCPKCILVHTQQLKDESKQNKDGWSWMLCFYRKEKR